MTSLSPRIHFLINPRSGGHKGAQVIRELRELATKDSQLSVSELRREQISDNRQIADTPEILVIGGGDGTFSTLLPELYRCKSKIGLLPLGTGNDLGRELGLLAPTKWSTTAQMVNFYRTAPAREVTFFNLYYGPEFKRQTSFINYVSFGFDAKVVEDFSALRESKLFQPFRGVWGNRIGYAAMGLKALAHRISPQPVTISSQEASITCTAAKSIVFANIKSIMGIAKSNLLSTIHDDKIECLVVDSIFNYFTMVTQYSLGFLHPTLVGSSPAWEIRGLPNGVPVQIDGEPRPDIVSDSIRIGSGGKLSVIVGTLGS